MELLSSKIKQLTRQTLNKTGTTSKFVDLRHEDLTIFLYLLLFSSVSRIDETVTDRDDILHETFRYDATPR